MRGSDSDDEGWLSELLSARGDPPAVGAPAPWSSDSEIVDWLKELCPAAASAPRRPDIGAAAATGPARALKLPSGIKRQRGGRPVFLPPVNPYGYPPASQQGPGMPTPCFSKEPGAGTCAPGSTRPPPRICFNPPALPVQHAPAQLAAAPRMPARLPAEQAAPRREFEWARCPEAVLQLPNVREMLEQIAGDPVMEWDLPPPKALAGAVLAHASAAIAKRLHCPAFKIGITTNPVQRWRNDRYGYRLSAEGFDRMVLLLATDSGNAAAFLEAALIGRFQKTRGCRNVAPGGEGLKPTAGPFFTYLVIKRLEL